MLLNQKESQQAQIRSVCFYAPMGMLPLGRDLIFFCWKKHNSFKLGPFMDCLFECFSSSESPFFSSCSFHQVKCIVCATLPKNRN